MRKILALFLLSIVMLVAGCSFPNKGPSIDLASPGSSEIVESKGPIEGRVYYFGFDRRLEIKEDVKMYVPLMRYLEKETGYKFRLHITPKNLSLVDEIGAGRVHFAAIGTVSYLQAYTKYQVQPLVRGTGENGPFYQAVIIAKPDSNINSLRDLQGKRFAFGSPNSTQGHLIPRIMLAERGISLSSLKSFGYFASHTETANAVISGQFDAGSVQDSLGRTLAEKGLVKIITVSDLYPRSGISVAPNVPVEVAEAVKKALLKFDPKGKDSEGLYNWQLSEMPGGFVDTTADECLLLKQRADKLGINL